MICRLWYCSIWRILFFHLLTATIIIVSYILQFNDAHAGPVFKKYECVLEKNYIDLLSWILEGTVLICPVLVID